MNIDALNDPGNRRLLLVHGRGFKPAKNAYLDIALAALRSGIERDFTQLLDAFDATEKSVVWYGDLSAEVLHSSGKKYDEKLDMGDRRNALKSLREIKARKGFRIRRYDKLPGKTALPEAMVGILAPVLGAVGLCLPLIRSVSKDFARYFDHKSNYATQVRRRLKEQLCVLLDNGDRIVLISHGTGSVIAYDVLWQFSHDPDLKEKYASKKIELWITLGAPLGDSGVRKRLLGAKDKLSAKYPANIVAWHNVAAEDDYTCHDNTVADDFKMMLQQQVISAVYDYKIVNLAVRYGKSNPHSSVGYYIHPRVAKILADWLQTRDPQLSPKYTS